MDNVLAFYLNNMENYFNNVIEWLPDDFIKLKNQLNSKDYEMAEKKIEYIEGVFYSDWSFQSKIDRSSKWRKILLEDMNCYIRQLKERVIELKFEKEKAKLNNQT